MKVAVPRWTDRVSPVFDVAKRLLVVEIERGVEISRDEARIEERELMLRAKHVAELGVNVLICGAISLPLEAMLASAGVIVIPHTCGPVENVLRAFVSGGLTDRAFLMPGCCGRGQQSRHRHRRGRLGLHVSDRKR